MSDAQATGVFGPGTRAGLKAHPLDKGSSGTFVQLFTAAMVFNRINLGGSAVYETFTGTYGDDVVTAVRTFQEFSALPVNGTGDFATWCQLLVSTGDPDRACSAVDCITTITDARAATLRAAGYSYVGRYLDERPSSNPLNKQIQPGELPVIFGHGLKVFPISQYYGGEISYFTYWQGVADAEDAHDAAVKHGFDRGTVIYFAVYFDATQADIDSGVIPYFQGIVAGLAGRGRRYVHGVYGSRNVCSEVTRRTYARWSFVSGMSTGFSGNMGYPLPENWSFNQIQTTSLGSGSGAIGVDRDAHRAGSDPAVSGVNTPADPVDTFVAYLRRLYDLALAYGAGDPNQRVLEYLRHERYNSVEWRALIGGVDDGFVKYVNAAGVGRVKEFTDPFYGIPVGVDHLGATCNAVYLRGKPTGPLMDTDVGDVAGWGGDLMTFYGEWRRDSDSYADGYTYCQQKLANLDSAGTFKLEDLIQDADGYTIAVQMRQGATVVEAMEAHYRAQYLRRMSAFFGDRFDSDASRAKDLARDMLLTDIDPVISAGRALLIRSTAGTLVAMPADLPSATLDRFCQGFADKLDELARLEAPSLAATRTMR